MSQHRPEACPEDARDLIPEILQQEDANAVGNDLCELIDNMMGPERATVEREVEEEVERQMAGEAVQATPQKAGHMMEPGAVDVLMDLVKALHSVREQRADAITSENARRFEQYEERASQKVYEANKHAADVLKRREMVRKMFKKTSGGFTALDQRSEAG